MWCISVHLICYCDISHCQDVVFHTCHIFIHFDKRHSRWDWVSVFYISFVNVVWHFISSRRLTVTFQGCPSLKRVWGPLWHGGSPSPSLWHVVPMTPRLYVVWMAKGQRNVIHCLRARLRDHETTSCNGLQLQLLVPSVMKSNDVGASRRCLVKSLSSYKYIVLPIGPEFSS